MAPDADDAELLDRYRSRRDEGAFNELVRRHLNLVYSAAIRRVGDRQLAEDVTQAVFMVLSRKPKSARASTPLSAWLLTTVRYAAANALKLERRRRHHETQAGVARAAGACSPNPSDVLVWQEIASELDDAVLNLSPSDRRAVLLRFFEQWTIKEVAQVMNTSEAAAGMRLNRAVEKLRQRLNRRGAVFAPAGAAGLATLISAHAVCAAPPGLVTALSGLTAGAAAGSAASLAIAKGAIAMMTWTKIKVAVAVVAVMTFLGTGAVVTLNHAQGQRSAASAGTDTEIRRKAEARVQAAEKVLALLEQRIQAYEPLTPEFLELQATAQRRVAEARIDASPKHASTRRPIWPLDCVPRSSTSSSLARCWHNSKSERPRT